MNQQHNINLWIPLFLAWILLGALALAFLPIILILVLILWPLGWGKALAQAIPAFYNLLCATRDLKIDVNHDRQKVLLYFK